MPIRTHDVVVRQRNVKWIELGGEILWSEFARAMICDSIRWLGVIVATEIRHPVLIPRRLGIWRGISIRRLLADPENRAGDVSFPWVEDATGRSNRASCWLCLSGSGGDDNLGCGGFRHGLLSPNARNRSEKKDSHDGPEDWKFSEKSKHH